MRDRGIVIVLATGRMFRSALPYAMEIGIVEPVICYQGAMVREVRGGILFEEPVPAAAARAAVEFSRREGVHVNLYHDDAFYVENAGADARRYADVAQVDPILVPDLMEVADRGSTKVVFVGEPAALRAHQDAVRALFEPDQRVTFSLPEFLEVISAGADKGRALRLVCERLGIPATEVIAAGDAPNDVEMLAFAGLALAPADAFPEAIRGADALIPPPGEDGIADLVERYLA